MPGKSAHVKNEKQYEALKDKGMSKERAARMDGAVLCARGCDVAPDSGRS